MAFGDHKGSLTASVASVTNPTNATGSVACVVGDLIFVCFSQQTALTASSVTDNLGNSYSAVNAGTDAGNATIRCFHSRVTVAGTLTQVSVAATASANDASCVASVIEGPFVASGFLDANPANTTDGTSPHTCPATGTLAQANEVVMAACSIASAVTLNATSPSVITQTVNRANVSTGVSSRTVTATTTVTPEFGNGATVNAAQTTASYRRAEPLITPGQGNIVLTTTAPRLGEIGRTVHFCGRAGGLSTANASFNIFGASGIGSAQAEANSQRTARSAGTFSKLAISINATGTTRELRARKNGANGNQVVSISDGVGGIFQDSSNTDAVVAGDEFSLVVNEAGTNPTVHWMREVFEGTDATANFLHISGGNVSRSSASETVFFMPFGDVATVLTTETSLKVQVRVTGTWKHLYANVSANSRTTDTLIRSRKNGANGNMLITVPGSGTGDFEDTSNSDELASGDDINFSGITGTGTGTISYKVASTIEAQTKQFEQFMAGSALLVSAGATSYLPLGGIAATAQGSLTTNLEMQHGVPVRASNFRVFSSTNTASVAVEFNLLVGGTPVFSKFTVPSGASGIFEDTTHVDALNPTDAVAVKFTPAAGGTGSLSVRYVALKEQDAVNNFVQIQPGQANLAISTTAPVLNEHVEYMSPSADDTDGGWTRETGSNVDLFASIDETYPVDGDADYIQSSEFPAADACKIKMATPPFTPEQPVTVSYRIYKTGPDQMDLTVRLLEGATERAEWVHTNIGTTPITVTQTLSGAEFASVTNWSNVYLQFEADSP